MSILLVTEKYGAIESKRDGGARMVDTLKRTFGDALSIMQFGQETDTTATWHFDYPIDLPNRFDKRVANAKFIAQQIKAVEQKFTHIIFIHISMQFGLIDLPLRKGIQIWTFPMFLTPSYVMSGEVVPEQYSKQERLALANSENIITPSPLEKQQLIELYSVPEKCIRVIPRGIISELLNPKIRSFDGFCKFCSVGSIKPQKNTLGLVHLFAEIYARFPGSTLRIIGPVQNLNYFTRVTTEIQRLGLDEVIEFSGYSEPDKLSLAIKDMHIHISTSMCETFGRTTFETLAAGLPNIARVTGNAAFSFLKHTPYVKFTDDNNVVLDTIEIMVKNLSKLSSMALEVGELYNDKELAKLLIAEIYNKDIIAIGDFDRILFHKDNSARNLACIKSFCKFPVRVLCSAYPIHDLLSSLKFYNLKVDWIIGYGGSMVTDGYGKILWLTPLDQNDIIKLQLLLPHAEVVEVENEILQIATPAELLPDILNILGLRAEVYQQTAFITNWRASKFRAAHRLLRYLNWSGRVISFSDGPYDRELLTYYDGVLVTSSIVDNFKK